ncbi:MAG: glutamate--cysteine ligase [Archangium sp.]|nr:glutamate--cysteine ligase [Archangium sp.]
MSLDAKQTESQPIGSVSELESIFRSAERTTGKLLLGLEHERLLFPLQGADPVPYEGVSGVGAVLTGFASKGFSEIREAADKPVIAMQRGTETLSLEPGGQFELSGSPFATAREAQAENLKHASELKDVLSKLNLRAVTLGYRPFTELSAMPWMPKSRYRVMRETLGARGKLAHHMMLMTATGQVSLDWRDEADCVKKIVTSARISPVLVGLYANSPIAQGKKVGAQSFRSQVWNDVDPARCGYPNAMLDGSFSYRAYVDWALDAPLLFLRRDGGYLAPKLTFREFLKSGFEGKPATSSDWIDHLSTLFPEVRIKKVLEIRAADCNSPAMTGALGAVMRGILYDATALDEAGRLIAMSSPAEHRALHARAQVDGLGAVIQGKRTLADAARELVQIAAGGLKRLGDDDVSLLEPLREIATRGTSPAVEVLKHFDAEKDPAKFLSRFAI